MAPSSCVATLYSYDCRPSDDACHTAEMAIRDPWPLATNAAKLNAAKNAIGDSRGQMLPGIDSGDDLHRRCPDRATCIV